MLDCDLERCFVKHFEILSSVKKNPNRSTFSYNEIDFYTLGEIFAVYRSCIPIISEFFSLSINNILDDVIETKMIVADSSITGFPPSEKDCINIYFGNDYGLARVAKPLIKNLEENFEVYFFKKKFSLCNKSYKYDVITDWNYFSTDDLTKNFFALFQYFNGFLNSGFGEIYKIRNFYVSVKGKNSKFCSPSCIESSLSISNKLTEVNRILDIGQKEYNQFVNLNSVVASNGLNFAT